MQANELTQPTSRISPVRAAERGRRSRRPVARLALLAGAGLALAGWAPTEAKAVSFSQPTNFSVGTAPQSVGVGDFNGDSDPDLAVVNEFSNSVSVLLGAAGGSFTAPTNIVVGTRPLSVAVGEFNGDSDPDLAVVNETTNDVSVLLGSTGGTFTGPTNFAVGTTPQAVAVGDFNADLDPDLAVVNEFTNDASILLGGAGGSFGAPTSFAVGSFPRHVAVGNFNGDSDPDLAVPNEGSDNISVLLGAAGGSFTGPTNFAAGSGPVSVAVGDFNGDADPDLAAANEGSNDASILLGGAGGSFGAATSFPASFLPESVAVGEFNGEPDPDIVVANQGTDNVSVLFGGAGGSFIGPAGFPAGDGPTAVAVADFNGDSGSDLVVANEFANTVSILLLTNVDDYPVPVGASPFRASLVPAFAPCTTASANASHDPALAGRACSPAAPASATVAVGPSSLGFVRMIVLQSGQCAPFDTTRCYPDFTIRMSVTDVRSGAPTGPDYDPPGTTDLTGVATLANTTGPAAVGKGAQITDDSNRFDSGGVYDRSGTVTPLSFPVPLSCTPDAGPAGSACNAQTTANTLVPGAAVAGKRSIWELGQLQLLDQGANGVPGDSDDKLFEVQGILVP